MRFEATFYLIILVIFYTVLRTCIALNFNFNTVTNSLIMLILFFSTFLFLPDYFKNNDKESFSNDKKLLFKFERNLITSTNLLTLLGTITSSIFIFSNINDFNILGLAIFSEKYRSGNFAGSGIYTGIIIYILPLLVTFLIMEGIDYRNIIFPSIVITVITLILGLRVYLLLPLLSYIIRTIENFINEKYTRTFLKNPSFQKSKKVNLIILPILATVIIVLPKLILSTRSEEAYDILDIFNSVISRFNYKTLLTSYFNSSINGLDCLLPILHRSISCDFTHLKYVIHSPIVGFTFPGNPVGWEIPMIPLFYLLNFNFLEISGLTILGSLLIFIGFFLKNKTNNFLKYQKPLFTFAKTYFRFILVFVPLLTINAFLFDYLSSLILFERLFFIGFIPAFISFICIYTSNNK